MLNSCILTGNLGAAPEIFHSSDGDPIATFNLAFRSSKKKTGWIKITCFQKPAEITERHLDKGARVAVVGILDQNKWEPDVHFGNTTSKECTKPRTSNPSSL